MPTRISKLSQQIHKERIPKRVTAIRALRDQQVLTEVAGSNDNAEITSTARSRLQELLNSDFLRAVGARNVTEMKALAARGATVDPHGKALEVENLQPIGGGFQYTLVCKAGAAASQPMLTAIRSGHEEVVRALIDLGSDVKSEYVIEEARVDTGTGFIDPQIVRNAACYGLSFTVAGMFYLNGSGPVKSAAPPTLQKRADYVSVAEQLLADSRDEKTRQGLKEIIVLLQNGEASRPSVPAQ